MASRCPIPLAFMHAAEFLPAKVQHQTLPFQLQPFSNGVCSIDGGHQSMVGIQMQSLSFSTPSELLKRDGLDLSTACILS